MDEIIITCIMLKIDVLDKVVYITKTFNAGKIMNLHDVHTRVNMVQLLAEKHGNQALSEYNILVNVTK